MTRTDDVIADVQHAAPSVHRDTRSLDDVLTNLGRFPSALNCIDWSKHSPVLEQECATTESARAFVEDSLRHMNVESQDDFLFVEDGIIEAELVVNAAQAPAVAGVLRDHGLGFWLGPTDATWRWVIEFRAIGMARLGVAP